MDSATDIGHRAGRGRLTRRDMAEILDVLAGRDPDIARAYEAAGLPPLRARPPGFASLLGIILSQQVSAHAAAAIRKRLVETVSPLTAANFLAADEETLRAIGLSRQKIRYGRALAGALTEGALDLRRLHRLDDEAAIEALTAVTGIGRWTAEIYLLFALRRPDIWPVDDLAVQVAVQRMKGFSSRPDRRRMAELGEPWRPWRSIVARLMWHYYRNAPT